MASETLKRQRNRKIKFCDSKNSEARRKLTLKNKAQELATLCDVKVCMVCFGPDGEVETWPENKTEVEQVISKYKKSNGGKKVRESLGLLGLLESRRAELGRTEWGNLKRRKIGETSKGSTIGDWFSIMEEKIIQFTEEELQGLYYNLGRKIQDLQEKLEMMQARETQNQYQNHQVDLGTQSYQPLEALEWFHGDPAHDGDCTNILSKSDNNLSIFPVLAAQVDEAFSGECYVNAESNGENCNNCLPDHPVLAADPAINEDWTEERNNLTINNYQGHYSLLGLEDSNWFWGTPELFFLD